METPRKPLTIKTPQAPVKLVPSKPKDMGTVRRRLVFKAQA